MKLMDFYEGLDTITMILGKGCKMVLLLIALTGLIWLLAQIVKELRNVDKEEREDKKKE